MSIAPTSLRAKLMAYTGLLVLIGLALSRAHAAGIEQWMEVHHQVVGSFASAIDKPEALPHLQQAEVAVFRLG